MQTLYDATTVLPECPGTTLLVLWRVGYNVLWCIQLTVHLIVRTDTNLPISLSYSFVHQSQSYWKAGDSANTRIKKKVCELELERTAVLATTAVIGQTHFSLFVHGFC